MSRQFDEYMEGKFEVLGETYEVVEPENFEELMQALHVREVIQTAISSLMHDEDSSRLCTLMDKQNDFIQEYLDSIGNFDNRYLISNIAFLAKKNSLRIGEIENMLGLSAGYISRTAKENSAKKLSIDVVWKIALCLKLTSDTYWKRICRFQIPILTLHPNSLKKSTEILSLVLLNGSAMAES